MFFALLCLFSLALFLGLFARGRIVNIVERSTAHRIHVDQSGVDQRRPAQIRLSR